MTNILRDIREDAGLGRVYLPAEDLERFGVSANDLRLGRKTEQFGRLMEFEVERARSYYRESAPLLGYVPRDTRRAMWALIAIYSTLLDRVSESGYDVLMRRISLSAPDKILIVGRAFAQDRAQGR